MAQAMSSDGLAARVPTEGMTPLDYGQQMYVPDTKPMVDLNVPIPAVGITDSAEGHPVAGPFLNG